jgi:hypothetical protein
MIKSLNMAFIIKSFFGVLAFFYVIAHLLVFLKIGHFILLSPIGAQSVLRDPIFRGQFFLAILFLALVVVVIFFIHGEYIRYRAEREQRVYKISLEKLSKLWSADRKSTNVKKKEADEAFQIPENAINLDRSKVFFDEYIIPSISFFPREKLSIIIELFKILESDGIKSPSVARIFDKDPEKTGSYKSVVTSAGLTSYDIFYKINLYEHTMNVLDESIKYIIKKDGITYETVLCDAIIVALAHDIGKLGKITLYGTEYSNEIFKNNPHHHISKLFFSESWPGYEAIEEAIFSHHSAPKSNALLTRMIIEADKEARKKELAEYMQKNKAKTKEVESEEEKEDEKEGESSSTPVKNDSDKKNIAKEEEKADEIQSKDAPQERTKELSIKEVSVQEEAKPIKEEQPKVEENLAPLPAKIAPSPVSTGQGRKRKRRETPLDLEKISKDAESIEMEITQEKEVPKIVGENRNDGTKQKKSNPTIPIEYTDEIENNILGELRAHINEYDEESIKGIKSMSYDVTIFFSVVFVNQVVEKYIHVDSGLDPKERKQQIISITKYIAGIWCDKGYTDFMSKNIGCSEVFLTIDDKRYKFLSIPINGAVFSMDAYALEESKDQWMRKILFSRFRS